MKYHDTPLPTRTPESAFGGRKLGATRGGQLRIVLSGAPACSAEAWLRNRLDDRFDMLTAERERLASALRNADAVVCTQLSESDLEHAASLRLVQCYGAGIDGIALHALPSACALSNVYGHEHPISEWVLMAMLALSRNLLPNDRALREGDWNGVPFFNGTPSRDLQDCTIGVVGAGPIGRAVIDITRPFVRRQLAVTRQPSPTRAKDLGIDTVVGLEQLPFVLRESDFIIVCVPLTESTEHMIGAEELALLGGDGYLVNVSRGRVIDEIALYGALRKRVIAGAAIDTWYRYPLEPTERVQPSSLPISSLPNVILSPHASAWTQRMIDHRRQFVLDQLFRLATDEPLENVLAHR